jgi:hypothetical protein
VNKEIMNMNNPEPNDENQEYGFGNKIRKFWSKYIYNGFFDLYNKGRGSFSFIENDDNDSKIYKEYQHFNNEIDLMKDMASEKVSERSMDLW